MFAGHFGGSWLQFSSHQVSVAPEPGTAWHVFAGDGGDGGGGEGDGGEGDGGEGAGPGGHGEGDGAGTPGNTPLHRAAPPVTSLQMACATSVEEAWHVEWSAGL